MEKNYTRHQEKIIKSYYRNRDDIAFQRVQELITELYLAEGKKRLKVWENMEKQLEHIGVPAAQIAHLKEADNPELIAQLIQKKM